MRVLIKKDAIESSDHWTLIDRILQRIEDGAHEWHMSDPEPFEETDWLKQIRGVHRSLFEGAAKKSAYPNQTVHMKSLIISSNPADDEMLPGAAATFLDRPLYVLMENKFTDGILLDCALNFLGGEELISFFKNRPYKLIEYVSAGGNGEIPKHVQDHLDQSKKLGVPARFVVFTDSDGKFHGDVNREADLIKEICTQNNIPFCVLQKRAIENYIPDEVFLAWRSKIENSSYTNFIDKLLGLSPEQRDFFPLKSGFREKSVHLPLYENIDEQGKKILAHNLGKNLINWLDDHKNVISSDALRRRDQGGDLELIIKIINNEI